MISILLSGKSDIQFTERLLDTQSIISSLVSIHQAPKIFLLLDPSPWPLYAHSRVYLLFKAALVVLYH